MSKLTTIAVAVAVLGLTSIAAAFSWIQQSTTITSPGSSPRASNQLAVDGHAFIPGVRNQDNGGSWWWMEYLQIANVNEQYRVRVCVTFWDECGNIIHDDGTASSGLFYAHGCEKNYTEPNSQYTMCFELDPRSSAAIGSDASAYPSSHFFSGKIEYEFISPSGFGSALVASVTQKFYRYQISPANETNWGLAINGGRAF